MRLSMPFLDKINALAVEIPPANVFQLPEKVLQFGTGVLLRGLPDYFIDKANKKGLFNGRIVVVKSTDTPGADAFEEQQGLYTLCIRGVAEGKTITDNSINAAISRVLSARQDWPAILACAENPEMSVIISNTTEVGISLINDDILANPPVSFPGKLLAFLYKRFRFFEGGPSKGMVIIPTELIPENGKKLESIIWELAAQHGLEPSFMDWLKQCNYFCNSLVDCIVPGKLPPSEQQELQARAGFTDELMIMSEVYRLWAIEIKDPSVRDLLSFSTAAPGVVLAPDIRRFRELKLRLLNGAHTCCCGLAHLAGFRTVKEAMANEVFSQYISRLMYDEIGPAIVDDEISVEHTRAFASDVLDRFRNPFLEHQWLSICLQYSSKMKMRDIPVIINYEERTGRVPGLMSIGFAALLLFLKCKKGNDGKFFGEWQGNEYPVQDDNAGWFLQQWENPDNEQVVANILKEEAIWGYNLSNLEGFVPVVYSKLRHILQYGVLKTLEQALHDPQTSERI